MDILWSATKRRQHLLDLSPLLLTRAAINPSTVIKNLGVLIARGHSMLAHVNRVISQCIDQLCHIKFSCYAPPTETTKTLVNSFVVLRVDLCNCLLTVSPMSTVDKLQRVLIAAMTIYTGWRYQSGLHMCAFQDSRQFKARHQSTSRLCQPLSTITSRQLLRSSIAGDLFVPRTFTKFGDHAFFITGPHFWNNLQPAVRQIMEHLNKSW